MDSGVIFCSVCSSREAEYSCICQFPLPRLCATEECRDAHSGKNTACFHYLLPTTAVYYVTARNLRSWQKWIVSLNHIQWKLVNSLTLLDTAIVHIEESYQRQVATLSTLKDQYIEKVKQLKRVAAETFNSAVQETVQNAINGEYVAQSEIAQWIWTMASKEEDDDTPLFQNEIREIEGEEIYKMFAVKVSSAFQSLAPWDMDFSAENQTENREEWDKLTVKITTLEQKDRDSENVIRGLREEIENNQKKSEQLIAEILKGLRIGSKSATRYQQALPQSSEDEEQVPDLEPLDEDSPKERKYMRKSLFNRPSPMDAAENRPKNSDDRFSQSAKSHRYKVAYEEEDPESSDLSYGYTSVFALDEAEVQRSATFSR